MKLLAGVTMLLAGCLLSVASAWAADDWEVALKVKAGVAENKLSFGQKADATDGIDGRYDVPAILSGDVRASFLEKGKSYWRDIKALAPGAISSWDLQVEATRPGPVELRWSGVFLKSAVVSLVDLATGERVNMQTERSFVFNYDGPRSLRIEAEN